MYTYIITVIAAFIAGTCFLKIRKKSDGTVYLNMGIAFAILGIISAITINLIRQNSLPTEDILTETVSLKSFTIDTSTAYVKYDTTGGKLTIEKLAEKPDTMTNVKTLVIYDKAHAKFLNADTVVVYTASDSVMFDSHEIHTGDALTIPIIEERVVQRVTDKWSNGWAMPNVREYKILYLSKSDIDYLKKSNPAAFKKWKIVKS